MHPPPPPFPRPAKWEESDVHLRLRRGPAHPCPAPSARAVCVFSSLCAVASPSVAYVTSLSSLRSLSPAATYPAVPAVRFPLTGAAASLHAGSPLTKPSSARPTPSRALIGRVRSRVTRASVAYAGSHNYLLYQDDLLIYLSQHQHT